MKRIYISDAVHEHLKQQAKRDGRTLQWVVESRLIGGTPTETPPSPKITEAKTFERYEAAKVTADLFKEPLRKITSELTVSPDSLEQDCCEHPSRPCKHWVWDNVSGDGYKNILSGRFREAD